MTNAHVVGASSTVKIVLNAGEKTQRVMVAHVIRSDKTRDLALLKTSEPVLVPALTLGDVSGLYETEPLATFGFPFGTDLAEGKEQYPVMTISTGKITALRRDKGDLQDIQFDASVNPGNSGGPVLDESGRVIGIVEAGIPGAALNFAIPVEKLRAMLSEPDIVFTPPRIMAGQQHRPAKFRIEVRDYNGRTLGFTVSLTLTQDDGTSQTFGAQPDGSGVFVVSAVPVPDHQNVSRSHANDSLPCDGHGCAAEGRRGRRLINSRGCSEADHRADTACQLHESDGSECDAAADPPAAGSRQIRD